MQNAGFHGSHRSDLSNYAGVPYIQPPPAMNDRVLLSPQAGQPVASIDKPAVVEPPVDPSALKHAPEVQPDSVKCAQAPTEPVEYTGDRGADVRFYTENLKADTKRLKDLVGGELIFVGSGTPPVIPDTFMSHQDYSDRFNKLTAEVSAAETKYKALTGLDPNCCKHYGDFVFGGLAKSGIPDDIREMADEVKTARMRLRYFLDKMVAVDLYALRFEVLSLHESITILKHNLRSLQFNGVNIGTQVFPDMSFP
jgi:hypothetical protein